jgi:modulator of FtsH protease HflK
MPWNTGGPGPWGSSGGSSGGGTGGSGGGSSGGGNGSGNSGRPGGGPSGPWGSGGRPGGGQLPDLDQLIAQLQAFIRGIIGRTSGPRGPRTTGGRGLALLGLAVVAFWLASGFYRVQPDEQGVVLRFGAFTRTTLPGLNYHMPWPIERVEVVPVTRVNQIEIGYRSTNGRRVESGNDTAGRDVAQESLMLTGDENIIDLDIAVQWRISDAVKYLFNTRYPDAIVKAVAESSIREVIGRTPIQPAMTERRAQIAVDVQKQTQQILDKYQAGIEITRVQILKADPPDAVIESFRDVQRANTDADRLRNEAQSYSNDIVPRAHGDAAQIVAVAEGAKQAIVASAQGETKRFLSVLAAYGKAKDITLSRLYIETLQDVLGHARVTVLDDKLKGLLPLLPLGADTLPAAPTAPAATKGAGQ